MKNRNVRESFKNMFDGFIYAFKFERNFRIHLFVAVLVMIICKWLKLTPIEFSIVIVAISFVITSELINTAIEQTVDLCWGNKHHKLAKVVKDVSAFAVFFSAIAAMCVGYLLIWKKIF